MSRINDILLIESVTIRMDVIYIFVFNALEFFSTEVISPVYCPMKSPSFTFALVFMPYPIDFVGNRLTAMLFFFWTSSLPQSGPHAHLDGSHSVRL